MELGTFGALIGFAIELEAGAADFYESARRTECGERAQETFGGLAGQASKHKAMLARSRSATSPDGKFTVIEVECLGACGVATPVMINDDFIDGVAAEKVSLPEVKRIFKRLATRRADNSQTLASISPPA